MKVERGATRGRDQAAQRQRGRRDSQGQLSQGAPDDRGRRASGRSGRPGVPHLRKGAGSAAERMDGRITICKA